MEHISEKDRDHLVSHFKELESPVRMVFFTQEHECQFCVINREILEELAALSDHITLEIYDFVKDKELAEKYGVDKIPATVLLGERDYGIRFFGIPAGYEFTTLVEDIMDVGRADPKLADKVKQALTELNRPVHLQVFVSPTCPLCPTMVRMAHRFALASAHVRADMVESTEFPHLVNKYDVQGVPHTVINETESLVGVHPEMEVVQAIHKALGGGKN